jgi:site-specific recombinase XerC
VVANWQTHGIAEWGSRKTAKEVGVCIHRPAVSLLVDEIGDVLDVDASTYERPPENLDVTEQKLALNAMLADAALLTKAAVEGKLATRGRKVFLLLRHTGMRISVCADLSYDCLRSAGPDQWAIHVPLGKLKTELMVPVDSFVRELIHRLRFFRSLGPLPADGRLLAWSGTKVGLLARLRDYLHMVCYSVGLPTDIVTHQIRHTYGTEMLRAGMGFATVMKLLGHTSPRMTMRYVDVTLTDLKREFQLGRSKPRQLAPQPKAPLSPVRKGLDGLIDSLLATQHVMEMFRRSLPNDEKRRSLDRLANRLTKILAELRKLHTT